MSSTSTVMSEKFALNSCCMSGSLDLSGAYVPLLLSMISLCPPAAPGQGKMQNSPAERNSGSSSGHNNHNQTYGQCTRGRTCLQQCITTVDSKAHFCHLVNNGHQPECCEGPGASYSCLHITPLQCSCHVVPCVKQIRLRLTCVQHLLCPS